jgi:hypothetical protein
VGEGEWEWFEDENGEMVSAFTPLQPRRMGMFTPIAPVESSTNSTDETTSEMRRDEERSDYAAEMNEEELEQHVAEQMQSNRSSTGGETGEMTRLGQVATALEKSAEALQRAAQMQLMLGQLQVSGGGNVAGVLGDTIRQTQAERARSGEPLNGGMDNLSLADRMARVMGVTPTADGEPSVRCSRSKVSRTIPLREQSTVWSTAPGCCRTRSRPLASCACRPRQPYNRRLWLSRRSP